MRLPAIAASLLVIATGFAGVAGAEDKPPTDNANGGFFKPADTPRDREANAAVADLEAKLAEIAALPPRERRAKEAKLGPTLEKLLETTKGTKHHNRALHLLAAWRLDYADAEGVAPLLDELDGSEYPSFKQAGQFLRVRLLLRQGKTGDARALAARLVAAVPELAGVERLVDYYDLVGKTAPTPPAKNLAGGPADPATGRSESWLLYLFIDGGDPLGLDRLGDLLKELADPRYAGKMRLVCVAFGAKPLDTTAAVNEVAAGRDIDLLWPNPGDGGAERWRDQWSLGGLPACALVGPDRTVMAVEPDRKTIAGVVGKKADNKPPRDDGGRGGGKGPAWQK